MYTQVVYEDYKISLEEFTEFMAYEDFLFTKELLLPVLDRLEVFIFVARASIRDMQLTFDCLISRQCNRLVEGILFCIIFHVYQYLNEYF